MSTTARQPDAETRCLTTLGRASVEHRVSLAALERAAATERVPPTLILNSQRFYNSDDIDTLCQRIAERRRTH